MSCLLIDKGQKCIFSLIIGNSSDFVGFEKEMVLGKGNNCLAFSLSVEMINYFFKKVERDHDLTISFSQGKI